MSHYTNDMILELIFVHIFCSV